MIELMLREDLPPKQKEKLENPELIEELKYILNDINQILIRLANRNNLKARELLVYVEKLEKLIEQKESKSKIDLALSQLKIQIKISSVFFTAHETSIGNMCSYVMTKIDEFIEG